MASVNLSTIVGGGGLLKMVAFESGQVAASTSGAVLTATAGTGQYIKVTTLSGAADETGMTLTIDGVDIFSGDTLSTRNGPTLTGATGIGFLITEGWASSNTTVSPRIIRGFLCTSFTLTKDAGSTATDIDYAYQTLEFI